MFIKGILYAVLVKFMMVFVSKYRIRYRLIFVCFILICTLDLVILLLNVLSTYKFIKPSKCFMDNSVTSTRIKKLDDVLLSNEPPPAGQSIFFIDTRCYNSKRSVIDLFYPDVEIVNINQRQACAIESAARHNPNSKVFVLFANPTYFGEHKLINNGYIDAILMYPNVHLRNLNVWTYVTETPVYKWFMEGDIFKSRFIVQHMSDFLRLVTLWRWGGLYLDLDAISLRSMENLSPNYAGIEPGFFMMGNSVLNFSPKGLGHKFATLCLQDFKNNFDGTIWAHNGPKLITRILTNLCGTNETKEMMNNAKRCQDFQVLHPQLFYAISGHDWRNYFLTEAMEEVMNNLKPSYVTHMWNSLSHSTFTKVGSNSPLDTIAKENCPYVYNSTEDYF